MNIDADQRDADWIKTLAQDLPTEKDAILSAIGGREQLDSFMKLPAAEAMPHELATQLGLTGPTPRRAGLRRQAATVESVSLDRGGYFGPCPVYQVTLRSDGIASWQGELFVDRLGDWTGGFDPLAFAVLAEFVEGLGFFEWDEGYFRLVTDPPEVPPHPGA